ncbi:MAG TPA: pyridoxamine 5'-phosphate oxidase family protein [Acidimicrobiales bacterium]|nr:pyridoxamine 5'-phosphate oxidase family protein [Acidimicrobiales bacterium]
MDLDRNGREVPGRDECMRLLGTATVGRVAITSRALPTVVPVSFFIDGDRIVVRACEGGELEAATAEAVVAFEADDLDPSGERGWSVVVIGVARPICDAAELLALRATPVGRWMLDGSARIIEISTDLVTGRRMVPAMTDVYLG